ncbi:hypothetical protein GN244_ATG09956 [Phytophthora infestans]|uniref:Uncharacterized protein n=1 Tax=Phytophthora infestans TaxID=4787 RepID=A0A833WUK8_PHYIN|nr:hypothetical protein GN244_ATG09956 [Phytophthora infestans]KAF4150201.1 hypothetical protein GN958_ATG00622 [Phytophthora infestans]
MRTGRLQERDNRVNYDALTTAELLGSEQDDTVTVRSTGTESEDQRSMSADEEQLQLGQLSALQAGERARSVRFEDDQSIGSQDLQQYPRAPSITSSSSSPRSPLLKKFSPVQDRRVNTVLLEALHLTEISRDEIGLIERSIKRLNDAIVGFAMLVDKQVKIVGAPSVEERGRIKADIQDLSSQLRVSNALIESTCARMKKQLATGRNQLSAHRRNLVPQGEMEKLDTEMLECTSSRCSVNRQQQQLQLQERQETLCKPDQTGIRFHRSPPRPTIAQNVPYGCRGVQSKSSAPPTTADHASQKRNSPPTTPRVSLIWILKPRPVNDGEEEDVAAPLVSIDLLTSVLDAVGLQDKEFLEMRDIRTFLHGILAFFIARNPALKFMDKAYHRRLIPDYINELADALAMDMQLIPQLSGRSAIVTPVNALEEYMCAEPYRFDRLLHNVRVDPSDSSTKDSSSNGSPPFICPTSPLQERNDATMNGGKGVEMATIKPREPELIETAEQTLGMAKLLHELATAECEARNGNRISIRAQVPHSKEFSKAYIASSKELMLQETGLH